MKNVIKDDKIRILKTKNIEKDTINKKYFKRASDWCDASKDIYLLSPLSYISEKESKIYRVIALKILREFYLFKINLGGNAEQFVLFRMSCFFVL